MTPQLGDHVRDTISGFEGVVYGITDFLHGCRRVLVAASRLGDDGKPIDQWFDEPQLEVTAVAARRTDAVATGGPRQAPARRGDAR